MDELWLNLTTSHAGEAFHRFALIKHVRRLVEGCRGIGAPTDEIQLTVADALAWAVRLRLDVIKRDDGIPKAFLDGARWARNRVIHGNAHLLGVERTADVDPSWDSPDILWDDPEVGWNGVLVEKSDRTARFCSMDEVPGDERTQLRPYYNDSIAGRRVVVVCGLLAGVHTLGPPFVTKP